MDVGSFCARKSNLNIEVLNQVRQRTNYESVTDLLSFMRFYDGHIDGTFNWVRSALFASFSPREQASLLKAEGSIRTEGLSFIGRFAVEYTAEWGKCLAMWTAMSAILLLSPLLTRERLRWTREMQWSSRRGRRILHTQMADALTSALLPAVINLAVYGLLPAVQGVAPLWDCPIFCGQGGTLWFTWTYGQYTLALAVFLPPYSENYVAMRLKAVPLVLGLGLCVWTCARQKRRELPV